VAHIGGTSKEDINEIPDMPKMEFGTIPVNEDGIPQSNPTLEMKDMSQMPAPKLATETISTIEAINNNSE